MKKLYLLLIFVFAVFVSQAQRAPLAINDVARVAENGTITINVLANDSNFNPADSVCITALYGGPSAWASVQGCTNVVFHPLNPTFVGLDTFYYISCDRVFTNLCDTGRVIVTVYILPPKALNDTVTFVLGDTAKIFPLANDTNYNPQDSIRITSIFGGPANWTSVFDSTEVLIHSAWAGYYGIANFYYRACDTHVPGLCDTGLIVVNVIQRPKAVTDTTMEIQPDTLLINVLANDSDFNALDSACVTNLWNVPAGWATVQGCGQVQFLPTNLNYAGKDTIYYKSCYTQSPTVCDTGKLIVTVVLPKPQVDFTWTEDSPCIAHIYNNTILADSVIWYVKIFAFDTLTDTIYNAANPFSIEIGVDSGFDAQVCLRAFNPTGDTTVCYNFWIQCTFGSNGIANITKEHLSVYPNPANDFIHIDMNGIDRSLWDDNASIKIYDVTGRVLKTIAITEVTNPILVSELTSGLYLIDITNKQNRKATGRFEVIH